MYIAILDKRYYSSKTHWFINPNIIHSESSGFTSWGSEGK